MVYLMKYNGNLSYPSTIDYDIAVPISLQGETGYHMTTQDNGDTHTWSEQV
jgi:hypothetical protein